MYTIIMGLFSFLKKDKKDTEPEIELNVKIDSDNCQGEKCAKCVAVCPNNAFIMAEGKARLKEYYICKNCKVCVAACPNNCITVN